MRENLHSTQSLPSRWKLFFLPDCQSEQWDNIFYHLSVLIIILELWSLIMCHVIIRCLYCYHIFRLSRVESELVLSEQKGKDLEILLEKERSDKEALSSSYRSELRAAGEVCSFSLFMKLAAYALSNTHVSNYGLSQFSNRKSSASITTNFLSIRHFIQHYWYYCCSSTVSRKHKK